MAYSGFTSKEQINLLLYGQNQKKKKKKSNCLNITCGLILFQGLTLRSIKSAEYFLQITQNGVGHEHRSDS